MSYKSTQIERKKLINVKLKDNKIPFGFIFFCKKQIFLKDTL